MEYSFPDILSFLLCTPLATEGLRGKKAGLGSTSSGSNGCDAEREGQAHGDLCRISRPWRLISCFLSHRGIRAKPEVWLMIFPQPQQAFPVPCGGSSSSLLPPPPPPCVRMQSRAFRAGSRGGECSGRANVLSFPLPITLCPWAALGPVQTSAFPSVQWG